MPIEIKDLLGLSGPLKKFIEVVSKGIGAISKPYLIKKTAEAKAYEIKVIAESIRENQKELKQIGYADKAVQLISIDQESFNKELAISERANKRIEYQEEKRQQNIENITQKAAAEIEQEDKVADEPVDDDWITRFFEYAKDISNDEMQDLWSKILAGEIKKPTSFSLRTLELLRNLTKNEAEVFSKVAKFKITSWNRPFLYRGKEDSFLDKFGITFEDRLLLTELGILQPESNISRRLTNNPADYVTLFESGKYLVRVTKKASSPEHRIPIFRFSKVGEELLNLVVTDPHEEYVRDFFTSLQNEQMEVDYSFIISKENGNYNHTLPWLKFSK